MSNTIITLEVNNSKNIANAITAVNVTGIDYCIEGEHNTLYIVFQNLTKHQSESLMESLNMNYITYGVE